MPTKEGHSKRAEETNAQLLDALLRNSDSDPKYRAACIELQRYIAVQPGFLDAPLFVAQPPPAEQPLTVVCGRLPVYRSDLESKVDIRDTLRSRLKWLSAAYSKHFDDADVMRAERILDEARKALLMDRVDGYATFVPVVESLLKAVYERDDVIHDLMLDGPQAFARGVDEGKRQAVDALKRWIDDHVDTLRLSVSQREMLAVMLDARAVVGVWVGDGLALPPRRLRALVRNA